MGAEWAGERASEYSPFTGVITLTMMLKREHDNISAAKMYVLQTKIECGRRNCCKTWAFDQNSHTWTCLAHLFIFMS